MATGFRYLFCGCKDMEKRKRRDNASLLLVMLRLTRYCQVVWSWRFGRHFAGCIRRDRLKPNDKWYMDEVIIAIGGRKFWLGRAIDTDADVLDIQVQTRRNTKASKCFAARLVSLALS